VFFNVVVPLWYKVLAECMFFKYIAIYIVLCGPGSSVGIATGYGLDSLGIES
jgi:hypothetical protein